MKFNPSSVIGSTSWQRGIGLKERVDEFIELYDFAISKGSTRFKNAIMDWLQDYLVDTDEKLNQWLIEDVFIDIRPKPLTKIRSFYAGYCIWAYCFFEGELDEQFIGEDELLHLLQYQEFATDYIDAQRGVLWHDNKKPAHQRE